MTVKDYLPIKFKDQKLYLLDQRLLPHEEKMIEITSLSEAHHAIKEMMVRGAPCIGFTAIYAMVIWLKNNPSSTVQDFSLACRYLESARPTAVNLAYELQKCEELYKQNFNGDNHDKLVDKLIELGDARLVESEKSNRSMATSVVDFILAKKPQKKFRILTHCNTGFLACGSLGTALGVVEIFAQRNLLEKVWVDETRPYLQGSRLTAYELTKLKIDYEIVVEGCASLLMSRGLVDFVVVGADRIVENGDTANKIGTSNLAILCHYYQIPFIVVAPSSSFDLRTLNGEDIVIEERDSREITQFGGQKIAPEGARAFNPSFDITKGEVISAIACEKGLALPPFQESIARLLKS